MNVELVVFRDPVTFRGSTVGSLHAETHRVTIRLDAEVGCLFVEDLLSNTQHAFPFHGNVKQVLLAPEPACLVPEPTVTLAKAEDAVTFETNMSASLELEGPRGKETVVAITRQEPFTAGITRRTRPVKA